MAYNFDNSTYRAPIGLGIGQVIPCDEMAFNVFLEPQVLIEDKGAGWPKWQIFSRLQHPVQVTGIHVLGMTCSFKKGIIYDSVD